MITKALNIKNIALEEMIENNPDVYFVEYNLLNHYYLGLKLASNLYAEQLKKKT